MLSGKKDTNVKVYRTAPKVDQGRAVPFDWSADCRRPQTHLAAAALDWSGQRPKEAIQSAMPPFDAVSICGRDEPGGRSYRYKTRTRSILILRQDHR